MADETKKSFILYHDYYEIIKKLPKEQAGELLSAIFEYEITGETPKLDFATDIVFTSIRQDLDRNAEKYEEKRQKLSENGKKGGRPKKDYTFDKNEDEKILSENQMVFSKSKKSLNVNVNVNDNVNDNENENVNDNSLSSHISERNEEREILENYLTKTKPNIRNLKAYITKLINNGDYKSLLQEAILYKKDLEQKEEMRRKEFEEIRLKEEEMRLQEEKEIAEHKAEQTRLRNEMYSKETIKQKLKQITDKGSAANILAEYYERCESPPPEEFNKIVEKYGLDTYEKICDYQKEAAMMRCREIVMRATKRF